MNEANGHCDSFPDGRRSVRQFGSALLRCFCLVAATICGCDDDSRSERDEVPHGGGSPAHDETPLHGFLGITFESVGETPLVVRMAVPGSGAAEAGIQPGDIVIRVGGEASPSYEQIYRRLAETVPADSMPVTIRRGEQRLDLQVRLLSFAEVESAMTADRKPETAPQ